MAILFAIIIQIVQYTTFFVPTELLELLERTRKALKIATGFIKGISSTIINDCDNQYVVLGNFKKFAQDTLNQIKTALEQKEQN